MPNVLLEGMSRGLVPIATRVGTVEDLVDSTNGFLIESKDVDAIRKSIESALGLNQNEVLEFSAHSIHKIKSKFTWSQISAVTLYNFQRVLEKS